MAKSKKYARLITVERIPHPFRVRLWNEKGELVREMFERTTFQAHQAASILQGGKEIAIAKIDWDGDVPLQEANDEDQGKPADEGAS